MFKLSPKHTKISRLNELDFEIPELLLPMKLMETRPQKVKPIQVSTYVQKNRINNSNADELF